jgi:hypothetical protein
MASKRQHVADKVAATPAGHDAEDAQWSAQYARAFKNASLLSERLQQTTQVRHEFDAGAGTQRTFDERDNSCVCELVLGMTPEMEELVCPTGGGEENNAIVTNRE